MSYDISLKDPVTNKTLELNDLHFMKGGTYAVGGTRELWLNITYNYAQWYYKDGVFPDRGEVEFKNSEGEAYTIDCSGIRAIYGLSGGESIPVLEHAIKTLEDMKEDLSEEEIKEHEEHNVNGYWIPTRSNAIKPLYQLLVMAKLRPDGIWDGD